MQNGSPCAYNASNTRSDPTYSRVHVFYRQWNAAGTSVDSISYAPFSGVNRITLSNCATYSTNYYWRTNTFSTASVAASAGTAINTNYFVGLSTGTSSPTVTVFTDSNYANVDIYGSHSNDGATINTPVYVFVDYKKVAPRTVVAENIQNLAFDYDGEVFGASHTVHGSTTLNSVKFKYSGTSTYITDLVVNSFNFYNSTGIRQAAIEWENGSDNWTTANYPKNAGTYNFRIRLAADNGSADDTDSLNINEATFPITVTINTIVPNGFNQNATVTYGDKISDIDLTGVLAQRTGLYNDSTETPAGSIEFSTPNTVVTASGSTQVSWTPASTETNYKAATLTLNYDMTKRAVTISMLTTVNADYATSKTDLESLVRDEITITGLAPRDETLEDDIISRVAVSTYNATLKPTAGAHNPTDPVGTYDVILSGGQYSSFNDTNYTVTYSANANKLVIGKKAITASTSVDSREYNGTAQARVSFAITGAIATDDLYIKAVDADTANTAVATFASDDAGTQAFVSWTDATPTLRGAAAGNYTLTIDTTGLELVITKLTTQVDTYAFANQTYHFGRTLDDIATSWTIAGGDINHPAGTFTWTDGTIVPTASVNLYYATFTPDEPQNYTIKENCPVTMNVAKGTIYVSGTLQGNATDTITYGDVEPTYEVVYTIANALAAEQNLTVDGDTIKNGGGTTVLTKQGSPEITSSYAQFSPAGSYAMTVSLNGTDDRALNYTFVADNTKSFTVAKRTVTVTGPSVEVTYGYSYNGTGDVTVTGIPDGKTITDITSDGSAPVWDLSTDYSITDSANRDAGAYDIDVDLANVSDNYTLAVVPGTLTVAKREMTILPKAVSTVYGSPKPTFDYRLTGLADFDTTTDITTLAPGSAFAAPDFDSDPRYTTTLDAGSYNIELYNADVVTGDNYLKNYTVIYDETAVRLTITAKRITVTEAMTGTITFGQTWGDAVFNNAASLAGIAGSWSFADVDLTVVPAWSARGSVQRAVFTPTSANYIVDATNATLAINKAPLGGTLIISGSAMVGEMLSADFSSVTPTLSVGEQNAYISYQWNGAPASADPSTLDRANLVLTNDYVGNYLTLTITASSSDDCPYTGSLTSAQTAKICPKLNRITLAELKWSSKYAGTYVSTGATFTPADYAANYGATVVYNSGSYSVFVRPNVTGTDTVGEISVRYNGLSTEPTQAGTYSVTVDIGTVPDYVIADISLNAQNQAVNSDGDLVYGPVSGLYIGSLTIEQAPVTVTFTAQDKVYDGETTATATNFAVVGAIEGDDVGVIDELITLNFADADVGEDKTVTATGGALSGNQAHNYSFTLGTSTADITKRTITAKVVAVGRVYDGTDVLAADHVSFINLGDDARYPLADTDSTDEDDARSVYIAEGASIILDSPNAGSRSISGFEDLALAGTVAGNYELVILNTATVTVKITQAIPNPTVPSFEGVYDKNATLSADYALSDGWTWDDGTVNPQAGRRTYSATYAVPGDDAGNYKTVSKKITVNVEKRDITFTAVIAEGSVVYGSARPTVNATYVIADTANFTGESGTIVNNVLPDGITGNITVSCSYVAGSDVGTYAVTLGRTVYAANYNIIIEGTTLAVTPRTVTTTASAYGREYDQTADVEVRFSALTNVFGDDTVYLAQDVVNAVMDSANAGTRTVTFGTSRNPMPTLDGAKAGNYTLVLTNPTLTIVITKADPVGVRFPTTASMQFGNTYATAIMGSGSSTTPGSFALENPNGTPEYAGTAQHTVIFTPTDSVNYKTASSTLLLTITKVDLSNLVDGNGNPVVIEARIVSTLKSGDTARCTLVNMPAEAIPYLVYNWYVVSDPANAATEANIANYAGSGAMITINSNYVGKYLYCEVNAGTGDSPFNGIFTATSGQIQEEHLSFWQRLWKWIQSIIHAISTLTSHVR